MIVRNNSPSKNNPIMAKPEEDEENSDGERSKHNSLRKQTRRGEMRS